MPIAGLLEKLESADWLLGRDLAVHNRSCMIEQGFTYSNPLPGVDGARAFDLGTYLASRYGAPIHSVDGRIAYGFTASSARSSIADDYPDGGNSAAVDAAMRGKHSTQRQILDTDGKTPVGAVSIGDGCLGKSLESIFGSIDRYTEFVQLRRSIEGIGSAAYAWMMSSDDSRRTAEGWAACMKGHGFVYDLPMGPSNADWPTPRPTRSEQLVAAADAECRASTGVERALFDLDAAFQQAEIEKLPDVASQVDFMLQLLAKAQ